MCRRYRITLHCLLICCQLPRSLTAWLGRNSWIRSSDRTPPQTQRSPGNTSAAQPDFSATIQVFEIRSFSHVSLLFPLAGVRLRNSSHLIFIHLHSYNARAPIAKTIKKTSTHKSTKTHAGNVFASRDLDLWPFDPKINGFQDSSWDISMSHLVILAASVFEISCAKTNRRAHRQTKVKTPPPRLTSTWVIRAGQKENRLSASYSYQKRLKPLQTFTLPGETVTRSTKTDLNMKL